MERCCFCRRDSRGRLETGQIKTARSISRTRRFLRGAPAGLSCPGLSLAPLGSKAMGAPGQKPALLNDNPPRLAWRYSPFMLQPFPNAYSMPPPKIPTLLVAAAEPVSENVALSCVIV
jgi:hypothetical protein